MADPKAYRLEISQPGMSLLPFTGERYQNVSSRSSRRRSGMGAKLLLKPWMKGVQERKVKEKRNSSYLLE